MSLLLSFLVVLFLHNADLCRIVQPVKNRVLKGHVMQSLLNRSFEKCAYSCELDAKCFSVNYFTHDGRCEMNNASREMFPGDFKVKEQSLYVQNIRKDEKEIDPCKWLKCLHGSTCRPLSKPHCACPVGFKGIMCETVSLKSLGIQDDNIIGDGKLTSSTAKQNHEAWRGRLNRNGSWKPETSDRTPEYRVNFGFPVNITYIATQGSPDEDCWITSFKLKYQLYKGTSFDYPQTFKGNTDRNTVVYHRLTHGHLNGVINLDIQPSSSFGCIGLRLEIYE